VIGEKRCSKCGEVKPLAAFYLAAPSDPSRGYRAACRACLALEAALSPLWSFEELASLPDDELALLVSCYA
jgi:hypothetical protein